MAKVLADWAAANSKIVQAREKSKQDRIAKELEKQARLELMRAELAKEEAEKAAQAESRKAEIMAGKEFSHSDRS